MATEQTVSKQQSRPEPIAIRAITFKAGEGYSIPRAGRVVSSITTDEKDARSDKFKIELLPWMRMYRVTRTPANRPDGAHTFLIPESWASAEVAD